MATSVSAISGSSAIAGASQSSSTTSGVAPSEDLFLQLLVAQIKNQDPLNPTDGTQFVSQLAQFIELEQVVAIRGDLDSQIAASTTGTSGTSATAAGATA